MFVLYCFILLLFLHLALLHTKPRSRSFPLYSTPCALPLSFLLPELSFRWRHLAPQSETPLGRPAHSALGLLLPPLLSFLKAASLPSAERLPKASFGQDGGSVWSNAEENKGGPRQVNEARRQLCAALHQYSTEAFLALSSNNILVIWVSRITVPL